MVATGNKPSDAFMAPQPDSKLAAVMKPCIHDEAAIACVGGLSSAESMRQRRSASCEASSRETHFLPERRRVLVPVFLKSIQRTQHSIAGEVSASGSSYVNPESRQIACTRSAYSGDDAFIHARRSMSNVGFL